MNFALAAPVLVQEKHQARIDEVHIPRNVITVLGKRGRGIEKVVEFFKTLGKLFDSSGSDTSSNPSSAPYDDFAPWDPELRYDDNYDYDDEPIHTPTSTDGDYGPYHKLAGEPPPNPSPGDYGPHHELAGEPPPEPSPSTEGDDGPYEKLAVAPALNQRPLTEGDDVPYHELAGAPAPNPRSSKDPDFFDWSEMYSEESPPRSGRNIVERIRPDRSVPATVDPRTFETKTVRGPGLPQEPDKNGANTTPEAETGEVERIRPDQ